MNGDGDLVAVMKHGFADGLAIDERSTRAEVDQPGNRGLAAGLDHRVDRHEIPCLKQCPVKNDSGYRRAFRPFGGNRRQVGRIGPGPVDSGP